MTYAYYPGCSLHGTAREYDLSTRSLFAALEVDLKEIPDWNCCGASSAHVTSHLLALSLPARNMAQADSLGLDIAVPCAACYNRMATTRKALESDKGLKEKVNDIIGGGYEGKARPRSVLDILVNDIGTEKIASQVQRPLEGLKVAAYYGCLLVRPPEVTGFDDPEDPVSMDRLMEAVGAGVVTWSHKTECCGASLAIPRTDVVHVLVKDIIDAAVRAGADAIVTACPMCHANLDQRQSQIRAKFGGDYRLPVYYITELLGRALDIPHKDLGLDAHMVDALGPLRARNLA